VFNLYSFNVITLIKVIKQQLLVVAANLNIEKLARVFKMLDNEEDNKGDRILAKALKGFYLTKGREIVHKSNLDYAYMLN